MPHRTFILFHDSAVSFSCVGCCRREKFWFHFKRFREREDKFFSPMTVKTEKENLKRFSCLMAMTEALIDEQWTSVFEAKHQTVYTYTSSRVRQWNMWNNGRNFFLLLCFTIAKPMKNNEETFMNSQKLSTIMWRWSHSRHFSSHFSSSRNEKRENSLCVKFGCCSRVSDKIKL